MSFTRMGEGALMFFLPLRRTSGSRDTAVKPYSFIVSLDITWTWGFIGVGIQWEV